MGASQRDRDRSATDARTHGAIAVVADRAAAPARWSVTRTARLHDRARRRADCRRSRSERLEPRARSSVSFGRMELSGQLRATGRRSFAARAVGADPGGRDVQAASSGERSPPDLASRCVSQDLQSAISRRPRAGRGLERLPGCRAGERNPSPPSRRQRRARS